MKHVTAIAGLIPSFTAFVVAQNSVGATVQTSSGTIIGHAARNRTQVSEYLGIPYAQPPLGSLRFAESQTYNSSHAFDASFYSPDCPQMGLKAPPIKYPDQTPQFQSIIDDFGGGRGNAQSEDCLTLNVWTKRPGSAQKTGVLLWIHGGRFTIGYTNTPFYQGQYLVDSQDIVFVSINYRLNIFGFSGAPGETQNVGLLDQRKAIQWVRDNIAGFGGDPSRISIMGQSAGGSAVDYYSYTYLDDPIVAGLISHSGTALSFAPNTPDFSKASFLTAAQSLGCSGSDVVSCMRSQDFHAVLNASAKVKPLPSKALAQPVFHPTIDNKTVFSLADYRAQSAAGTYAKLPYLAGNTDKEDGFYHIAAAGQNITLTPQRWLTYDLEGFTCATAVEAASRAAHGVPMWRYRYFGDWPNLRLYPSSGAYHGVDLHMIFGGTIDITGIPDNINETWTTEYMMWAWATFVKNPHSGLSTILHWPEYDPHGNTLVRLGYNQNPGPSFVSPDAFDNACPTNGSLAEAQGAF